MIEYRFKARLIRCVDGDTFDADVDLGFHVWARLRFRLLVVDTPERGQPGFEEATRYLAGAIADQCDDEETFELVSTKTGKYGRWLALIPLRRKLPGDPGTVNELVANWLRENGYEKGA